MAPAGGHSTLFFADAQRLPGVVAGKLHLNDEPVWLFSGLGEESARRRRSRREEVAAQSEMGVGTGCTGCDAGSVGLRDDQLERK